MYAVCESLPIDVNILLLEELAMCLRKFSASRSERLRVVLGSLVFQFLEERGVPLLAGEVVVTCSDKTYDVKSLTKSMALGKIYKKANKDEDGEVIAHQRSVQHR